MATSQLGAVDLPAAVAMAIGIPAQRRGSGRGCDRTLADEPFEHGLRALSGQVVLKAARLALTPKLAARDFRGTLHFGEIAACVAGERTAALPADASPASWYSCARARD